MSTKKSILKYKKNIYLQNIICDLKSKIYKYILYTKNMVEYNCIDCNYITNKKTDYNKHLNTQKHKSKKNNEHNNTEINIILDKLDEFKKELETLKRTSNQNTDKIVKEARTVKKSLLTILNTKFKDTPSIEYIQENEFRKELELEYKCKLDDTENKLFMRIFSDYENKKLINTLSSLIIKFVKKEDQKIQSVFNIDSARGNYATKIEDMWLNDKSGLQLKKYTLDVIIKYMLNAMDLFRLKLIDIRKENIKHITQERSDYLMKYQGLLLEVNAYLTNSNTHKKVILFMCPELRLDQKLLDSIE